MKRQILALLKERGEYVSGQELCERFGVSRTAVWKAVEQLKKEGYAIDAVRNKGYYLAPREGDFYSHYEISSGLTTRWMGQNLVFHETVGSTNVEARHLAEEGALSGTLVVANQQTDGRGRRGRSWDSPSGKNIYFSIMLRPDISPAVAPQLTLVMALSVAEALAALDTSARQQVAIKWPNDVVMQGKKVTGILTEMNLEQDYIRDVVIGVGINVKAQEFPPAFAEHATCVDVALGTQTNRSRLICSIMEHFEKHYEAFIAAGNLSCIKDAYEQLLVNLGRQVRVLDPQGEFEGIARGIDDSGKLLVERPDGSITGVYAGEVSVRGLYGYV